MPVDPSDIAHLLRRTGFGAPPALVAELSQLTLAEAVDRVLDVSANPADDIAWPYATDWENWLHLRRWWMNRMATVPNPLQEKLTFFWHGHFVSSYSKVGDINLMYQQNHLLRQHAFGDFEALAQAVALDPAMLLYLDNFSNVKSAPNENFARELMELFMLGVDQGYTQADVVAMARAWSGYGVLWTQQGVQGAEFHSWDHDYNNKTIFGLTRNWDGPQTITEMVRGSRSSICATFIAKKLWSFFAAPTTDPVLISNLSTDLLSSNWNIGSFLRKIFNRSEFYSAAVKTGLVRPPVDWVVTLLKTTGVSAFDLDIDYQMVDMGQGLFEPPNVSGWKQNQAWLTETVSWIKEDVASSIALGATNAGFLNPILAMTPTDAVTAATDALWIDRLSAGTRQALEAWVAAERTAGGTRERYNIIRLLSLTPEFQLA